MTFKKLITLIAAISYFTFLTAQSDKLIPPKKLQKDFEDFVAVLEAHPAPYRHISKEKHDSLIQNVAAQLDEPMETIDFFKLICPILSTIKDGHTSMVMPLNWLKNHRKENGVFPYDIHITEENRMFIIFNHGKDNTIALGAEVFALNDVPVNSFIEEISKYISYEQEIFRNTIIENQFDFYLLLYFGEINEIKIDYLSDAHHTAIIQSIPFDDWEDKMAVEDEIREKKILMGEPYEYSKIRDDVGLLKIYSFAIYDLRQYEAFLRKIFRQIRKDGVKSLVIDVRGNTGGYPKIVSELLHYVSEKHFKTMARSEAKVSQAYRDYYNQMIPSRNLASSSIRFIRGQHSIDINGLFTKEPGSFLVEESLYNEPPKESYHEFTGDVYLLTDRRSYSASSSFAATFRCYQMGFIIGSETGGTKVFHANSMGKALDQTGIRVGIATTRLYTTCYLEEDEGIVPDIKVEPTVQDLVARRDAVLDYTLRVIDKVKKMRNE